MSGLEAHAPLILKEVSSQTEQEEDQASKYCIYTLVIKMLSPVEKLLDLHVHIWILMRY